MTRENILTPSAAVRRRALDAYTRLQGRSASTEIEHMRNIATILWHHPHLGLAWYEKLDALLRDAEDALAEKEAE